MDKLAQDKRPTSATKKRRVASSPIVLVDPADPLFNLSSQDLTNLRKATEAKFDKELAGK